MCNSCLNRRTVIGGLVSSALITKPTNAQPSYPLLCSWAGGNFGSGLGSATGTAIQNVQDVMNVIGYTAPMNVFAGGVPNAAATVINSTPAIIYNPSFLGQLYNCHPIAPVTVLAHEVGHHASLHTTILGNAVSSWNRELQADWISGLAMARLGIDLNAALSGILCSFGPFSPGSPSHPDSQNRLSAVQAGWQSA